MLRVVRAERSAVQQPEDEQFSHKLERPELVIVRQERPHSQFQHLRAALAAAEASLRDKWGFQDGDEEDHSIWAMFGDDDDLWHPRRAAEFVQAILEHPLLDGVASFATLARANVERSELMPEDQLPTTREEVDAFLSDGRATLQSDEDQGRAWLQERREEGLVAGARLPVPESLGLEYFDFYPRLRLLREFFEVTSPSIVANRFCDLCLDEFLAKYPLMGTELGLDVSFFEPSSWMYFYAHRGTTNEEWSKAMEDDEEDDDSKDATSERLPTSAGVANGHVSSHVPVTEAETKLSLELYQEFEAFDITITPTKLAKYLAHFRYGIEVVLVRCHKQVLDQRELDTTIVDVSHSSFPGFIANLGHLEPEFNEAGHKMMYKNLRNFTQGMLQDYEVSVLWHCPEDFIPTTTKASGCTQDVANSEDEDSADPLEGGGGGRDGNGPPWSLHGAGLEVPEKVLQKWARSVEANDIMKGFAVETSLGSADSMTFQGFSLMIRTMNIELESLPTMFTVSNPQAELDLQLHEILTTFALRSIQVDDFMTFPHFFELFGFMRMEKVDFVRAFEHVRVGMSPKQVDMRADKILRDYLRCERQDRGVLPFMGRYKDSASFDEVLKLVAHMGMGLGEFVAAWDGSTGEGSLLDQAHEVLRRFVKDQLHIPDTLRFRSVYMLLEALHVKVSTFLHHFRTTTRLYPQYIEEGFGFENTATVGKYRLRRNLFESMTGSVIYLAEEMNEGTKVILKWPTKAEEVAALQAIAAHPPEPPGLQRLLCTGMHQGKPYHVTELLGTNLDTVFGRLDAQPLENRWEALRIIGRISLRRLEAIHKRGLVHCDLSPHNILLGPTRYARGTKLAGKQNIPGGTLGPSLTTLYIVDLGCARPWPGGGETPGEEGSLEFSSARTVLGGERTPADDLEALAWTLVHGMCGELPWMPWLQEFYVLKSSLKEFKRAKLLERVANAKRQLLEEGWNSLEETFPRLQEVTVQLDQFMKACIAPDRPSEVSEADKVELPDYRRLRGLLSDGSDWADQASAHLREKDGDDIAGEEEDNRNFEAFVVPMF